MASPIGCHVSSLSHSRSTAGRDEMARLPPGIACDAPVISVCMPLATAGVPVRQAKNRLCLRNHIVNAAECELNRLPCQTWS